MNVRTAGVFGRLLPVLRPEWRAMAWTFVVATVSTVTLGALAVTLSAAVGHAVVLGAAPPRWVWILVAGLVAARSLLTWHEMDLSHSVAFRVLARLRMAVFDGAARSVPARRRAHSGRAATVMTDVEKLEFLYAHTVAQVASGVVVFLGGVVAVAFIAWPLAVCLAVAGALLVASTAVLSAATARAGASEQELRNRLSERVVDVLGGLREVLGYGIVDRVRGDVAGLSTAIGSERGLREVRVRSVDALRELIVTCAMVAVVGLALVGGDVPAEWFAALIAGSLTVLAPLAEAASTVSSLHPLVASAARVGDEIESAPVVTAASPAVGVPDGPLGIRFSSVIFGYGDGPVLDGLDLLVNPGEHVALSGPSGAGKSTVAALAARVWDPDGGDIALVGAAGSASLRELDDADLRRAVGYVEQDAALFHGTVRDNLSRGAGRIPDERLREALSTVGADSWIALDDALGEGGVRLSGGQHARLCLARAIVRDPRLLILDEVTAALDAEAESDIARLVTGLPCTVLVISHRAATNAAADRTIELDGAPAQKRLPS